MTCLIAFIAGIIIGGTIGVILMAALAIGGTDDGR